MWGLIVAHILRWRDVPKSIVAWVRRQRQSAS
jgi:hypothetical protein